VFARLYIRSAEDNLTWVFLCRAPLLEIRVVLDNHFYARGLLGIKIISTHDQR
jgi:hypothetical protein